jgi:hypothetical protein
MQTNGPRTLSRSFRLLVLGALLAIPVLAQPTINPGSVLLSTPAGAGTQVDFAGNPIPADFFCPGSAPFTGTVPLQGVPLATNPPGIAGGTDTLVEHQGPAVFINGTTNIQAILVAMHLASVNNLQIVCGDGTVTNWRVDVCACGPQAATNISVQIDPACKTCGTANGVLPINVCLTFTEVNTGQRAGPIQQSILLDLSNVNWCYSPGRGETVVAQPFTVDTDCDRQPDRDVLPSTNFHTGYKCATQGFDCWTIFASLTHCHPTRPPSNKLHCINPVCGER